MKYAAVSMLIHWAVLSIPVSTKTSRIIDQIEVFMLDFPGSGGGSSSGGGGKQGGSVGERPQGRHRFRSKEPNHIQSPDSRKQPVKHKPESLSSTSQSFTPGELAERTDISLPSPAEGVQVGLGGSSGSGSVIGSGAGGTGSGSGMGGSGTGSGHGSGHGDGMGSGGIGFGSPGGPRFLRRHLPEYPILARRRNKEGSVVLMVVIDAEGKLIKVDVVSTSDEVFVEPSLEAVKKSTFLPARRNGQPVMSRAILPIRFSLKE